MMVGAPPREAAAPAAPTAVLWVGEVTWGSRGGEAMQRRARAWAEAGALVLYLDPDPGLLQWSGRAPQGEPDPGRYLWRAFMAAWIDGSMRADGPVWVLPWVRRILAADGQVYTEPAALVEGLAELALMRPVVVAPHAGRWTGGSPAVSAVHRPACLGDPPAEVAAGFRAQPVDWQAPWPTVVIWLGAGEDRWAEAVARHLPDAQIHIDAGALSDTLLARAAALVVSPARVAAALRYLPGWLERYPRLTIVGPRGPAWAAERVLPASSPAQYVRALGLTCWLFPQRAVVEGPWEARWRALAQGPCPRCVS